MPSLGPACHCSECSQCSINYRRRQEEQKDLQRNHRLVLINRAWETLLLANPESFLKRGEKRRELWLAVPRAVETLFKLKRARSGGLIGLRVL